MPAVTADVVEVELRARTAAYLANIKAAEQQFSSRMAAMASSADVMERKVSAAGNRMSKFLGRAIASIAVASAIKDVQELADSWTSAGNKLAAAGVKMEDVGSTQQRIADLARSTRTEFDLTANTYARLTRATAQLGATQSQVTRATEIINKAVKAGGQSTQEQAAAILQLTQALASGNLQGDELRSLRENAPVLAQAIAKEFGTTIGGLKKLGSEGKLEVSRVFKAILDGGDQIDQQFGKTRATIGDTFVALRTEAGRFLNELDRASGASSGIAGFVTKIADDFDLLAQAVVISAAVVSTALGVRMSRALAQTAVQNSSFVRSIIDGTASLDLQAAAARKTAREVLFAAQDEQEAARASIVASRQKIIQLEQEAVAYRQNIALAEEQAAVARRQQSTGRDASGAFASKGSGKADAEKATRALIANRMQLSRVTKEAALAEEVFTVATNNYVAAAGRTTTAQLAVRAAMVETSLVTRAAAVSMTALSAAMNFFGGPLGVAIIAVAGALTYFATEAAKAKVAGENAQSVLDNLQSTADQTRTRVDNLSTGLRDNKNAANDSATGAKNAANAYDQVATAAANAAEMIKYMTAAQRQSELEKIQTASRDLDKSISGFNPIATNDQERVLNARRKLLKTQGAQSGGAGFGGSDVFVQQAFDQVKLGKATKETADAVLEYKNAVAVLNDKLRQKNELDKAAEVVRKGISAPTLQRPKPDTSNLITQPTSGSKTGSGRSGGRKGPTEQELLNAKEMLDLENRINVARAAGADDLAEFLQDQREYFEQFSKYIRAGYSNPEAEQKATEQLAALKEARSIQKDAQIAEDAARERARDLADEKERILDFERRTLYMEEQRLSLDLEIARAAGNSEKVKELEKQLELLARIRELEDQGGFDPKAAREKAKEDQTKVDDAETVGKVADVFKSGIRAALSGDLGDFVTRFWQDALGRATDHAVDALFDALDGLITQLFKSGSGSNSGLSKAISDSLTSLFGGGHAGGGLVRPGKIYKVGENGPEYFSTSTAGRILPNSQYQANGNQGAGNLSIQVVNQTGVPAKANVERNANGAKISLQPLFDEGVKGSGRSGALKRGLQAIPGPVRRA